MGKPIKTLRQAEKWCEEHNASLAFCRWQNPRNWIASCFKSDHPRSPIHVAHGSSPVAAVEALRRKVEGGAR